MNLPAARPSHVRYLIVALTTFVALLLYLDRISLSQAELYVREDVGLTRTQMGWALSAFFWAYALAQVPGGWLADRYGARLMLTIYLAAWSICTGLVGVADSLVMVILFRLLVGLFEAGAYPACAGLIRHWVPLHQRGLASGIVSLGGRFGNVVGGLATAFLIGFFLASDAPNQIRQDDLLETRLLCREIVQPEHQLSGLVGQRLLALLPADVAQNVRAIGAYNQKIQVDDVDLMKDLSAADRAALCTGLNHLMAQADLTTALAKVTDRLPKNLRAKAQEPDLGPAERERFLRLALEAAFPDSIRKLQGPGWRPTMMVYGIVGVLAAGFFWWYFRDRPAQHSAVNAAERDLIAGAQPLPSALYAEDLRAGPPPQSASGQGIRAGAPPQPTAVAVEAIPSVATSLPLYALVSSFSMWMNCLLQFSTNVGWVFLMTWFPTYLSDHGASLEERGRMTAVVFFIGLPALLLGGLLTDWMVCRFGQRWGRALPIGLTRFVAAGAFLLGLLTDDPWMVTWAMCLVQFGTDLGLPALWGYCLDVGGKHTGAVLGWGNMFGNLGAAISPPLILAPFVAARDWDTVFLICAGAFVVSGVAGLLIDARQTIGPQAVA